MKTDAVRITIDQLRQLVERMDNEMQYHNMTSVAYVTMKHQTNGKPVLQFEQPCGYGDCNSAYYRFE